VPVTQIQAALDQVFRESFNIVQANGEALLRVAVVHYTPADSAITRVERKLRTPVTDPATGQQTTAERSVVVEQWVARGQIAIRAEVVDASTGVLLDGFAPQAAVQATQVVSVDHVDRLDRTQLPASDQVLAKLIADLAAQFRPRYCPPAIELEIPLAVDDELRGGNQLARNGDLAGAAKAWETAVIAKPQNAGDRAHNLGTAYETQAYDMLMKQAELTKVRPYLDRAAKHYAEASGLDPDEKYITRAVDRIRKAAGIVEALDKLEQKRQKSLAAKAQPSPWPPGQCKGPQAETQWGRIGRLLFRVRRNLPGGRCRRLVLKLQGMGSQIPRWLRKEPHTGRSLRQARAQTLQRAPNNPWIRRRKKRLTRLSTTLGRTRHRKRHSGSS